MASVAMLTEVADFRNIIGRTQKNTTEVHDMDAFGILRNAKLSVRSLVLSLLSFICLGLAANNCLAQNCVIPPDGLVGWWRAEGNGNDSAGTNNGTLYGVSIVPGKVGQAFSFVPTQTRVRIPDSPDFELTNSLSIEGWIKPTGLGGAIFQRGDINFQKDPYVLSMGPDTNVSFAIESDTQVVSIFAPIQLGVWQHIAGTLNGTNGTMSLYVDGVLLAQTNTSVRPWGPLLLANGAGIGIGNVPELTADFNFTGLIDEMALYSQPLSADEIQSIYNAGSGGKCQVPPSIVTQPENQSVIAGSITTFGVAVIGTGPFRYQWLFNGTPLAGASDSLLTLVNPQLANAGTYSVTVSNKYGGLVSSNATLTVNDSAPQIVSQPQSQSVDAGTNVTLSATVIGTDPRIYQWFFNGNPLAGATNSVLLLSNAQPTNAGDYWLVVTNIYGAATSSNATLTVNVYPPTITTQPQNRTVNGGSSTSFTVAATGTSPLAYQWLFNGNLITGATNTIFSINNVQPTNAGNYSVVVTNLYGTVTSSNALLTVIADPPVITSQPTNRTVSVGSSASFTVAATGSSPLRYQWLFNGNALPGAISSILTINNAQPTNAGNYSVVVTNIYGTAISSNALLTVIVNPPLITSQPTKRTVNVGSSVSFTVVATGTSPLRYQWLFNGNPLPGAISSILTIFNAQPTNAGTYSVIVTNLYGSVTSSNATLTVNGFAPTITTQPQSQTVNGNSSASFTVIATGTAPLGYQWLFNGNPLAGATRTSLTITNAQPPNAGNYSVVVTNFYGSVTSSNATLTVNGSAPTITTQPQSQTVNGGTNASLTVIASGTAPLSYQWSFNSNPLAGATNAILTITNVQPVNAGSYSVTITNFFGAVTSSNAVLTVNAFPPAIITQPVAQFANAGSTVGFVVAATGTPVLSYQWRQNGTPLAGATGSSLIFTNVQATNAGSYSVVVTNQYGSATSANALLTIFTYPPSITLQPTNRTVGSGSNTTFTVTAGGTAPFGYQWLFNGNPVAGATGSAFSITNVQPTNAGNYTVTITNLYGSITSSNALLTVLTYPPQITLQPTNSTVDAGDSISFIVAASGTAPFSYQWLLNGNPLAGATDPTLTIDNAQLSNAGTYSVVVTNSYGSITSSNALLTVITHPPQITLQPTNKTINIGGTGSLTVTAIGTAPLAYQWWFNGNPLIGATSSLLTITNAQPANAGNYAVVITNHYGSVTSSNASLMIGILPCTPPPAGLVGWWRAEGDGNDSTGTNNGTLYAVPTVPGKVGQAFSFVPPQTRVRIPDSPDFQLTNSLSIEGWIKPTGLGGAIFQRGDDNFQMDPYGLAMGPDSNVSFTIESDTQVVSIFAPVQLGVWQHIAGTLDGTNGILSLYVNGVLLAQTNTTVRPWGQLSAGNGAGIGIGNVPELDNDFNFTGLIDEMSLYSRPLSSDEIQSIYNADSDGKCLGAPEPPSIITQPTNQTVNAGSTATFAVIATGTAPIRYQWFYNETPLVGATGATLIISNAQPTNVGTYSVTLTNQFGSVTSSNATLTVNGFGPGITTQPQSQTVNAGSTATFAVIATGTAPLGYQWLFNGNPLAGATRSSLTITNAQPPNAGNYSVVVTNFYGSITSSNATLTVNGSAPGITTQPQSQTVNGGTNTSFTVGATGSPVLSYQWSFNGNPLAGATNAILTITNVQPVNAGSYSVTITNFFGAVTSSNAVLTVNAFPPAIITQPVAQFANAGSTVGFVVAATGTPVLSYQWRQNGTPLAGATGSSLIFTNVQATNAGSYSVVVTNQYGSATSANALLTIFTYPPSITLQPTNRTVGVGSNTTFTVTAGGTAPFGYQWLFNGNPVAGATGSVFSITNVQPTNAGNYTVTITNLYGSVTSSNALLTVLSYPPQITLQPTNETINVGRTASLTVAATGTAPLAYQWWFNGNPLVGATNTLLTITNAQPTNAGNYAVVVTNLYGSVTSSNALLTVVIPPCTSPPVGLVGWWRAEGNGRDSVSTNHGTLYGVTNVPGKVGRAFSFIPPRHRVRIEDNVAFQLTNSLTIEGWIMPTGLGGVIFQRGDSRFQADPYVLSMGPGTNVSFAIESDTQVASISAPVQLGVWQHIAGIFDGANGTNGTMSLYVNGVLLAQTSTTVRPLGPLVTNFSSGIGIGNIPELSSDFNFTGLIDEMALYSRALSTNEIQDIYNSDSTGKCLIPPSIVMQPVGQTNYIGTAASFIVNVIGADPFAYEWQRNGTSLLDGGSMFGSSTSNLNISPLTGGDSGTYTVKVSNPAGSTVSSNADLFVIVTYPQLTYGFSATNHQQLVFSATNGSPNGRYTILTSTNVALPLTNWTPLATNYFNASGTLKITNSANTTEQQRYYQLRIP